MDTEYYSGVIVCFEKLRAELSILLEPGLIGEFDHIELIEVIGTPRGGRTINLLSIAVFAEGRPQIGDVEEPQYLTKRIGRIGGFKDWSFGVMRTFRPIKALDQALATLDATGKWMLSGRELGVGRLQPEPKMFVPPNGTVCIPLNNVLKNNFWAGSHVFRLTDQEKASFIPFFDDRRRLQELSDAISNDVPIALAGLADLLGDVLIQLPVTILVPAVKAPRGSNYSEIVLTWRNSSAPRPLLVAARSRSDELLVGTAISERFTNCLRLPIDSHNQSLETEFWDPEANILVGATAPTSTIKKIELGIQVIQPEPRVFCAPTLDNNFVTERVQLTETMTSDFGKTIDKDASFWLGRRQQIEERRRLEETRDFVQYRPQANPQAEKSRSLADLHFLINAHGQTGVDLWDPYLSSEDILRTLFWCKHSGAPMRALTDGRDPPPDSSQDCSALEHIAQKPSFLDRQRAILERYAGNCQGLRLEYKTRRGQKGWHFHDRFLIFPNMRDGPRAWSLGTSINSFGQAHHILQRVSNPVMVAGAFEDLWEALDEPDHIIWSS